MVGCKGNENGKENTCKERTKNGIKAKPTVGFEMLSLGRMLFTVNGEIECVAYLMAFVFIVQH